MQRYGEGNDLQAHLDSMSRHRIPVDERVSSSIAGCICLQRSGEEVPGLTWSSHSDQKSPGYYSKLAPSVPTDGGRVFLTTDPDVYKE